MSENMTITLNGNSLGRITAYDMSFTAALVHIGTPGGGVADAIGTTTAGPTRIINITSEVAVSTSATLIGSLKSLISGYQEITGPFDLVVTDTAGLFPSETVKVLISSFNPSTIDGVVNHISLSLTLVEVDDWL